MSHFPIPDPLFIALYVTGQGVRIFLLSKVRDAWIAMMIFECKYNESKNCPMRHTSLYYLTTTYVYAIGRRLLLKYKYFVLGKI